MNKLGWPTMRCDDVQELLELYALGALDADEHAEVAAHLASCPTCQRLADELADVATALPQALAAASPLRMPATAKARLLQSLDAPTPAASSGDQSIVHDSATPPSIPVPL